MHVNLQNRYKPNELISSNDIINISIGEDLFFDLFSIMFNSMSIIKHLEEINKIQKDYIEFLKQEEKKDLEKLIEINKKS